MGRKRITRQNILAPKMAEFDQFFCVLTNVKPENQLI